MKKLYYSLLLIALITTVPALSQVAVNTDGSTANPSAMLDIKSDTAGILIPRMTAVQRDAINNPANGLLVYVTDDSTFYFYASDAWVGLSKGENGWTVSGDTVYSIPSFVGIGTTSPKGNLGIESVENDTALYITAKGNVSNASDYFSGIVAETRGTSTGNYIGFSNKVDVYNQAKAFGVYNDVSGTGLSGGGLIRGLYNNLTTTEDVLKIGTYNYLYSPTGSGNSYGTYNNFYNEYSTNSAYSYGVFNFFNSQGNENMIGFNNYFSSLAGDGKKTGLSNNFYGGDDDLIGVSNNFGGNGNGLNYGTKTTIATIGSGDKYGSYVDIRQEDSFGHEVGGIHYGIFSKAEGNTNYAGYFMGRMYMSDSVGIGTDSATAMLDVNGTFRLRDGSEANGYLLSSDADGNASWVDGSLLNAWLVSNNFIYTIQDSVGIGTSNPGAPLEVNGRIAQTGTGKSVFLGESAGITDDFSDNRNVFVGYSAGMSCDTGVANVAIGANALNNLVGAKYNVAIGDSTLFECKYSHTIVGYLFPYFNTAIGAKALKNLKTYTRNTAIGYKAGYSNTRGQQNTIIGAEACVNSTGGSQNIAIGYQCMMNSDGGFENFASGFRALGSNTGDYNIGIGRVVLENNTGDSNFGIGKYSLFNNSGNNNIGVGAHALYHNAVDNNIALGDSTLAFNTSAYSNIAIGIKALASNTTESNLVAIGDSALYRNGIGTTHSYEALKNTAVGSKSLYKNTTGYSNTGIGFHTLHDNITGNSNTALGSSSLSNANSGSYNTAVGTLSLFSTDDGSNNAALGYFALYSNISGHENTGIGSYAGRNATGSGNVFIGFKAGYNESGSNKLYIANSDTPTPLIGGDFSAGRVDINGTIKITGGSPALGNILTSDATGNATWASGDTLNAGGWTVSGNSVYNSSSLIGMGTSSPVAKLSLVSTNQDTAISISNNNINGDNHYGIYTELSGSGSGNKFGCYANIPSTTGGTHYAIYGKATKTGSYAGYFVGDTYISQKLGIGTSTPGAKLEVAGHIWQTSTGYSVFLGENAGASDDLTSNNNVFVGYNAGNSNSDGYDNTAIGFKAMEAVTSGDWNTAIGHFAYQTGNFSNSTALGDAVAITASSQVRIGHNVTSIGGPVAWTNTSDGRFKTDVTENVPGIEFIKKLRPVTYHLDVEKLDDYTGVSNEYRNDPVARSAANEAAKQLRTGFIAQEVEQAAQSLGFNFDGVDTPKNSRDVYGLRYAEFVVPLVKAVQEQETKIEQQQQTIANLKSQLSEMELLKQRVEKLEKLLSK